MSWGTLRVQVGDKVIEAPAGLGVFVAHGTPHTYWNANPIRTGYLLVMTANIDRLIQEIHAVPDRNPAALKAVFERHDSELIDS